MNDNLGNLIYKIMPIFYDFFIYLLFKSGRNRAHMDRLTDGI